MMDLSVDDLQGFSLHDLLELDLEYRLTIALGVEVGSTCDCGLYLIRRREVLIPEILKQAKKKETNPAEEFHQFAVRLHQRHGNEDG